MDTERGLDIVPIYKNLLKGRLHTKNFEEKIFKNLYIINIKL